VTSVLSFSLSQRTQRRYRFENKSSRADTKFGNSSTQGWIPAFAGMTGIG